MTSLMNDSSGKLYRLAIIAILHHTLSLIDGIQILIRVGAVQPAILLLRALQETRMKLMYVLQKDTERRAMAMLHMHIKNEETKKRSYKAGTPEFNKLSSALKGDIEHSTNEADLVDPDVDNKLKEFADVLSKSRWTEYNAEYTIIKKPEWYKYFGGPENLRDMAKDHLNMLGSYELFYRRFSQPMHADDIIADAMIDDGRAGLTVALFRRYEQIDIVADLAAAYELKVLGQIVNTFLKTEEEEFQKWASEIALKLRPPKELI